MTMSVRTFWILLGSVVAFSPMLAEDKAYDAAIKKATQALGAGNLAEADKQVDVAAKIEPASAQTANLRGLNLVEIAATETITSIILKKMISINIVTISEKMTTKNDVINI